MIKRPVIKSNYQFIRLWFAFYKLALKDKSLKDNIKKSNDNYQRISNKNSKYKYEIIEGDDNITIPSKKEEIQTN